MARSEFALTRGGAGTTVIEATLRIVSPAAKRTEVVGVMQSLKGPTEVETGCRSCQICQDVDDCNALTFTVRWDCRERLEEYLRSERFRRLLPYIELSVQPPRLDVHQIDALGGIEFLIDTLRTAAG